MKANHNSLVVMVCPRMTVSNGSKILKSKQFTTENQVEHIKNDCFQWFKDTKMKANHNICHNGILFVGTVSNGSKILK